MHAHNFYHLRFLRSPWFFCFISFFILQCKNPTPTQKKSNQSAVLNTGSIESQCSITPEQVQNAFGLAPIVKIHASNLKIQTPSYVTLNYADNQNSILLQISPIASKNADEYPDFAKYKILDANNKICLNGQTGSSFFDEIHLPSSCRSGTLTISAQACASTFRLLEPDTPCGPEVSTPYQNQVNSKSTLQDTLALIQENIKERKIVALWLADAADHFLNSVDTKSPQLTSAQQMEISLAQLFTQRQTDFVDIFSSELYEGFANTANTLKDQNLNLTETGSPCVDSSTNSGQTPVTVNTGVTGGGLNLDQILNTARQNYGDQGNPSTALNILTPTGTSTTTTSGTVANGAKVGYNTTYNSKYEILGGVLLGASIVWGVYLAAKIIKDAHAMPLKEFRKKNDFLLVDSAGAPIENVKSKKFSWAFTAEGTRKVFLYEGKHLTEIGTDPTTGKKRYVLSDVPVTNTTSKYDISTKIKNSLFGSTIGEGHTIPNAAGVDVPDKKLSSSDLKKSMGKTSNILHGVGAVSILIGSFASFYAGGAFSLSGDSNPWNQFANDMIAAQGALARLYAEYKELDDLRTHLVTNSLTQ